MTRRSASGSRGNTDSTNPKEDTHEEGGPTALTFYVQVDDIEASLKRAVELGATVIVPVTTIPKTVTFALFADPQGNCIGMAASQIPD